MITDEWREQNAQLHARNETYGSKAGQKHNKTIRALMQRFDATTVLDYGCGKGSVRSGLGECVSNYDPAIPEWSAMPEPADLVVCLDVLEHVEPQFVGNVLDHIRELARKAAWFVVACRKANEHVPDGRNTHASVHPPEWWRDRMLERFVLLEESTNADHDAIFLTVPNVHNAED